MENTSISKGQLSWVEPWDNGWNRCYPLRFRLWVKFWDEPLDLCLSVGILGFHNRTNVEIGISFSLINQNWEEQFLKSALPGERLLTGCHGFSKLKSVGVRFPLMMIILQILWQMIGGFTYIFSLYVPS